MRRRHIRQQASSQAVTWRKCLRDQSDLRDQSHVSLFILARPPKSQFCRY